MSQIVHTVQLAGYKIRKDCYTVILGLGKVYFTAVNKCVQIRLLVPGIGGFKLIKKAALCKDFPVQCSFLI